MENSNNSPMVIFSVQQSNSQTNEQVHKELIKEGMGIEVLGSYKGEIEKSIVCDIDKLHDVLTLAKAYNQESILVIDESNNAELIYLNGTPNESIGRMVTVTKQEALSNDAWSYRADLGLYFMCK